MVASSQLSFCPQPLISVVWSGHLHPCVSGHSGLLFTPCVSRNSHSLGTFKSPLMWYKEIDSFRNVLTHTDFNVLFFQTAENVHLLKLFIYYVFIWPHQILGGAHGIFAVLCGIFWVAVQTLVALRLSSCSMEGQLPLGMWDFSSLISDWTQVTPCELGAQSFRPEMGTVPYFSPGA